MASQGQIRYSMLIGVFHESGFGKCHGNGTDERVAPMSTNDQVTNIVLLDSRSYIENNTKMQDCRKCIGVSND
jgi:hypothetical protein